MATSSFLDDAKKQDQTTTVNAKPTNNHPFSWINTWIIYCPMITNTTIQNNKTTKRHKLTSKIAYLTVILICIFLWAWDVITQFHDYGFNLFTIVWSTSMSLTNICRLISVYYFYNYFKFYGTDTNKNDIEMQTNAMNSSGLTFPQYNTLTKKFSSRMKIILILVTICLLAIHISSTVQLSHEKDKLTTADIYAIFYKFFSIYFYDIPLFLAQFILSIFYCEGCIFVKTLVEMIDKSINIDFQQAIQEYSLYRHEFKKQIKLLEIMLMFRLCSLIAWVWIDITAITEAKTWLEGIDNSLWLVVMIFPFFEIVMAGNAATKKFYSFRKKLYAIGTDADFFSDVSRTHAHSKYLFLLHYVTKRPFLIKIFAKEVSFKNALKITAAFAVAKIITYLFKHKLV